MLALYRDFDFATYVASTRSGRAQEYCAKLTIIIFFREEYSIFDRTEGTPTEPRLSRRLGSLMSSFVQ